MYRPKLFSKVLLEALGVSGRISPRVLLEQLQQKGLLNRLEVERLMICHRVDQFCAAGMSRCDAMERVAAERHCSYSKICANIYQKN